jgi:hypothetical protein
MQSSVKLTGSLCHSAARIAMVLRVDSTGAHPNAQRLLPVPGLGIEISAKALAAKHRAPCCNFLSCADEFEARRTTRTSSRPAHHQEYIALATRTAIH